jgi:hypothetical protein
MIKQRAFFFSYKENPGLGILAEHLDEGWKRINLYLFGLNADELQRDLVLYHEAKSGEGTLLSGVPAQSKAVLAGGVVFKGLTCLLAPDASHEDALSEIEGGVEGMKVLLPEDLQEVQVFNPMRSYWTMFRGILPGITKVIFFEYATQLACMGMAREKDLPVVEELFLELEKLRDYITIPKPLRTDEYDPRSDVYLYLIRNPLKEELQGDYVQRFLELEGLKIYSTSD